MKRKLLRKFFVFISAACLTAASFSGCGNENDIISNVYDEAVGNETGSQAGGSKEGVTDSGTQADAGKGKADSGTQGDEGKGKADSGAQGDAGKENPDSGTQGDAGKGKADSGAQDNVGGNGTGANSPSGGNSTVGENSTGSKTEEDNSQKSEPVSGTVQNAAAENVLDVGEMFSNRDLKGDYKESESAAVTLSGSAAQCNSKDVEISGNTVTIKAEGTYILSGTLNDGMIIVDADETAKVQLVLKGVSVSNSASAAIYVKSADKVFVTLAQGTVNTLTNGGSYTAIDDNNIDAVIFSKCDLTINGSGSLEITAKAGHGIVSKDDLKVMNGNLIINAEKHGLSGKDSVRIAGGTINITSGKDGIQADHDKAEKGYVYIAGGTLTINASGDGISASGLLQIDGGSFDITAGKGSSNKTVARDADGSTVSTKGIKAVGNLVINDGSFAINSQDDALHTNGDLTVNGGEYRIATGDDGLHGDETTTVAGGKLNITTSYEGIEGKDIVISGGYIDLYASDDGINAAGGRDQSGFGGMFGGFGGGFPGGFGQSGDSSVLISGGTIYVNADGDGLDSNGTLTVTGGEVYVDGPVNSANGALDYDTAGEITGGTVVALGASGMAQNFSKASNQGSILINTGNRQAGTAVSLKDADGKVLLSYTSKKAFSSVLVSCEGLVQGGVYTLSVGDSDTNITMDSLIYGNSTGGFGGGRGGKGGFDGGMGGFGGSRGGKENDSRNPGGNVQPDMGGMPGQPEGTRPGAGEAPQNPSGGSSNHVL